MSALALVLGVLAFLPQPSLGGVVALTLASVCLALFLTGLVAGEPPARAATVSIRDKARRPLYRRLCDPDAAGRARPRAPGAA